MRSRILCRFVAGSLLDRPAHDDGIDDGLGFIISLTESIRAPESGVPASVM